MKPFFRRSKGDWTAEQVDRTRELSRERLCEGGGVRRDFRAAYGAAALGGAP